jgi:hypothetical protein
VTLDRRALVIGMVASGAVPALAQYPEPSVLYIVGPAPAAPITGFAKLRVPAELPNVWLKLETRNLFLNVPRGTGWHVKRMRLTHPFLRRMVWDTDPYSSNPMLVISFDQGGTILNRADGSVAGLNLSRQLIYDLFVLDDGWLSKRTPGYVLEIETLDGTMRIPVQTSNQYDKRY